MGYCVLSERMGGQFKYLLWAADMVVKKSAQLHKREISETIAPLSILQVLGSSLNTGPGWVPT